MRTDEPRGAVGLRFYTHLDGRRRRHFCSIVKPPSTPAVPFAMSYQGTFYPEKRLPAIGPLAFWEECRVRLEVDDGFSCRPGAGSTVQETLVPLF